MELCGTTALWRDNQLYNRSISANHGAMARQNHARLQVTPRIRNPNRTRDVSDLPAAVFDPETLTLMRIVLDDVSIAVTADEPARSRLAQRILGAVRQGERDPVRLRACALRTMAN
jgi:hypothetical protein